MANYQTINDAICHVEEPLHRPLEVIDLKSAAAAVSDIYKNFVLTKVDGYCVRMAVMTGEYRWHRHPRADECFLTIEGTLEIDLDGGRTVQLRPGQAFTIPAGVVHRTRSAQRSVNLCFEHHSAYTDVEFTDGK